MATLLLRARGRRADGDRQPAARADAQPDRGRRARRHPRGHDQLHQHRGTGSRSRTQIARRRGRRAAGQPGAAQQPRLPRRGAAAAGRDLRAARRRRGALHLRLGPRLPARLPPDPHAARRPARRASRCWRPPPPPTPGSPTTSPSSSGTRRPGAARLARPRVAAPRGGPAQDRRSSGWPGSPTTSPSSPGSGIVYCLTVAATQEVADYLRCRGHEVAAYSGQTETTERLALEEDLVDRPGQGAGRDQRARHGLRRDLGFVVNMGAPPSPVAYYQQVGRAGRGTGRAPGAWCCCRRSRTATSGPTSPRSPSRARSRCAQTLEVLRRAGRPDGHAALETRVELNRTRLETMLKVLDVDGAVRRVRGGWEATGQDWAYDAERYARVREAREREQQAMLDYLDTDRVPDAVPARPARRPRGRALRALRQLRRASTLSADGVRGGGRGGRGPAGPAGGRRSSRARCGRPRSPPSGSTCAARSPTAPSEGRAVARLTDLGYGRAAARAVPRRHPRRAGAATAWRAPWSALLDDWRPRDRRHRGGRVGDAADADADLATGSSRYLAGPGGRPLRDRRPRRSRPARGRRTPPSGSPRSAAGSAARRRSPEGAGAAGRRPVVTGWTLTLAAQALRKAGAAAVLPLALATQS